MRVLACLALVLPLAACSAEPAPRDPVQDPDPAVRQALGEQITIDPDLALMDESNAALTGPVDQSIPPVIATREAIDAARQEAAQMVGGSDALMRLELPGTAGAALPETTRFSVIELAREAGVSDACLARASLTAIWAARLPQPVPIYPRGNTREAAGSDERGCNWRAVRFATPVPVEDVARFYATMLIKAGMKFSTARREEALVLTGRRGAERVMVALEQSPAGITEAGLVVSGL